MPTADANLIKKLIQYISPLFVKIAQPWSLLSFYLLFRITYILYLDVYKLRIIWQKMIVCAIAWQTIVLLCTFRYSTYYKLTHFLHYKMTTRDSKRNQISQHRPPPAINSPSPETYHNIGVFPSRTKKGENYGSAFVFSAFKKIWSLHQFKRKWLCWTVFYSAITNHFEGLYDPVKTVYINRFVLKERE